MKAVVYSQYGSPDVLHVKEIERPTPADDEVLIKIHAVSLNRSDWEGLTGKPLYARIGGLTKPRRQILGSDIAGSVEMVGSKVEHLQPGDEVFGDNLEGMGGFAEYVCVRERLLAPKPATMTFEQAATIPQAAVIALQGIRSKGKVQPGQKVLINGAGGGTGMFAVQLAKLDGAEVTGVDGAGKQEFMVSLGADHVIDYTQQDFTKSGREYDLILDLVAHRSAFDYQRALAPKGTYYLVGGSVATMLQVLFVGPWLKSSTGKNIRILMVQPNLKDMVYMAELCQAGKIAPVIDRRFSLDEVPEALRLLGEGHAKGKIVITVDDNTQT